MLANILLLILSAAVNFVTLMLLARFAMQWQRVSFRNQLGQFVAATTNWLVMPLRRVIPGLMGLDLASLVAAWLLQSLLIGAGLALRGAGFDGALWLLVFALGFFELLRMCLYLVIGVVIFSAILSWVNPHAPIAPVVQHLAEPLLRPIRRFVPPIANVDLSPLVLLVLLQVVLMLLGSLQATVLPIR